MGVTTGWLAGGYRCLKMSTYPFPVPISNIFSINFFFSHKMFQIFDCAKLNATYVQYNQLCLIVIEPNVQYNQLYLIVIKPNVQYDQLYLIVIEPNVQYDQLYLIVIEPNIQYDQLYLIVIEPNVQYNQLYLIVIVDYFKLS